MINKIFIIEDDVNILFSLQAKFRVEGFEIEIDNGNGENPLVEIISKIKNFQPDMVITDLILPRVSGFEIIKFLKSEGTTKHIPIFVFSNLSDNDSRERGLSLGVDYYAIKNKLSVDDFIESVKKVISNKKL